MNTDKSTKRVRWALYFDHMHQCLQTNPEAGRNEILEYLQKHAEGIQEVVEDKGFSKVSRVIGEILSGRTSSFLEYRQAKTSKENTTPIEFQDKKEGELVHWSEYVDLLEKKQDIKARISSSQSDFLTVKIPSEEPICIMVLGDLQLGSFGTDYALFKELTKTILETPNLYVILVGDLLQLSINMRGLAEVMDNGITPDMQYEMLKSWLGEIKHKVIAATWCNHGPMREEKLIGYSPTGKIYGHEVPYFKGIGEIDLTVGEETYKIAASHFFRGKSMYNKAHAPMRYMREKANHIEIAIQGDFHEPAILQQEFGGLWRLGIVCGSIQTNSNYAKRCFSLRTLPNMPCFTVHPKKHLFNAFATFGHYQDQFSK